MSLNELLISIPHVIIMGFQVEQKLIKFAYYSLKSNK